MPAAVRVWAPSRLHFGLLSFGHPATRQFGGAGVMVDQPGLTVTFRAAERLSIVGPLAERALEFAHRFAVNSGGPCEPACRIEIESAPPTHAGLGTGTQLALAIAAGLDAFAQRGTEVGPRVRPAIQLAKLVGRGERSAIGTHGFAQGGLLVEGGKFSADPVSPLVSRIELPAEWRFVLVIDRHERGLSGTAERDAFAALPAVSAEATAALCRELVLHLLPSAATGNFDEFGESLYRYGHQAGMLFAKRQGGPYAGSASAELVAWIRGEGVRGVGQSSWGPTIFALLADQPSAERFARRAAERYSPARFDLLIAGPANRGARVETL
jgi:beta-ribofuranosylaminobenzene 5'-phosphate synthase